MSKEKVISINIVRDCFTNKEKREIISMQAAGEIVCEKELTNECIDEYIDIQIAKRKVLN